MPEDRPRISISIEDLKKHFNEQMRFLENSADSYDSGFEGEAKRLALTLRILLYDHKQSKSLLGQLGMKNMPFFDSSAPFNPNNLVTHGGLVTLAVGPDSRYIAMLDDKLRIFIKINFDKWWNDPVFVDSKRQILSRGQLILIAADQDGGAHVDPRLDKSYSNISRDGSLGWMAHDRKGDHPLEGPERAALRQITHEVLKSLIPGYTKMPDLKSRRG